MRIFFGRTASPQAFIFVKTNRNFISHFNLHFSAVAGINGGSGFYDGNWYENRTFLFRARINVAISPAVVLLPFTKKVFSFLSGN